MTKKQGLQKTQAQEKSPAFSGLPLQQRLGTTAVAKTESEAAERCCAARPTQKPRPKT